MSEVWGPDVSKYQGVVDWKAVAKSGATFGIAKASEGSHTQDSYFSNNWKYMKDAGLLVRGAYHYAHTDNDPLKDAANFVDTVTKAGGLGPHDILALDAEDVCAASKKVSAKATADWCLKFVKEVQRLSGLPNNRIWVYTGAWWWNPRAGASDVLKEYPLWVSAYVAGNEPPKVGGWSTWTVWQYTSGGTVAGVAGRCDVSRYNGTLESFKNLVGFAAPPVVKPPSPKPPVVTPPVTKPTVSLAKVKPGKKNDDVLVLQKALKKEFPDFDYSSGPGVFGPNTKKYYQKWQYRIGARGKYADGIPGIVSLTLLGKKRGFKVTR